MFLWITSYLIEIDSAFSVLRYITVRAAFSALTALFITLFFGGPCIRLLQRMQLRQVIRSEGPATHFIKKDTPTMGGVLIAPSIIFSCLLWADLANINIWLLLCALILFTLIGMRDDLSKIRHKDANGMRARSKFLLQSLAALALVVFIYHNAVSAAETELIVPFFKNISLDLGWGFIVLSYLVIVSSANSVNMTDGLDGLVLIPCILIMTALSPLRLYYR